MKSDIMLNKWKCVETFKIIKYSLHSPYSAVTFNIRDYKISAEKERESELNIILFLFYNNK